MRDTLTASDPTAIDLFAGPGGLTLGLKSAGFRVVGAVEVDPLAAATYHHNHPEVVIWREDIRTVRGADLTQKLGLAAVDLVAGCPPCQGFSSVRTRNRATVDDPRNDLIAEYVRIVRELRPRAVMLENVPRLRHDERWHFAVEELERLGYPASDGTLVLDAADHGVPQRRKRLVMVCAAGNVVPAPGRASSRATVRDAIGHLSIPGRTGDRLHDLPERRSARVMEMIRSIPCDGGGRLDLQPGQGPSCHEGFDGFKDVYGRMRWNDVAPTITGGCHNPSKGRFLHPEQDRAITMREAAILQGFPRGYYFRLDRGKAGVAGMIGNAMPPPFIQAHAVRVRDQLLTA
jgi:DNA (cytosine-5)-methyltransferase 1